MKEVNINFFFKGIDGKDTQENAGIIVAQILAQAQTKNPVKFWEWAKEFHAGQTVKMTTDDVKILESYIKEEAPLTAMAKAQIIEKLA